MIMWVNRSRLANSAMIYPADRVHVHQMVNLKKFYIFKVINDTKLRFESSTNYKVHPTKVVCSFTEM